MGTWQLAPFPFSVQNFGGVSTEIGDVAQLGERRPCKAEVVGSSPIVSTDSNLVKKQVATVDGLKWRRYSTSLAILNLTHVATTIFDN